MQSNRNVLRSSCIQNSRCKCYNVRDWGVDRKRHYRVIEKRVGAAVSTCFRECTLLSPLYLIPIISPSLPSVSSEFTENNAFSISAPGSSLNEKLVRKFVSRVLGFWRETVYEFFGDSNVVLNDTPYEHDHAFEGKMLVVVIELLGAGNASVRSAMLIGCEESHCICLFDIVVDCALESVVESFARCLCI
jgi:hypothetical protein